jgi:hypothetical protein
VITRAETAVSIVSIPNMVRPGKSGRETRTVVDGEDAGIVHAAITFTASSVTQRRRRPLDRNTPPLPRGEMWQGRNLTQVALSLSAQPRSSLFTFVHGQVMLLGYRPTPYGMEVYRPARLNWLPEQSRSARPGRRLPRRSPPSGRVSITTVMAIPNESN